MSNEYETTLEQRAAFYTEAQWKQILEAYVRGACQTCDSDASVRENYVLNDSSVALLKECREKFIELEENRAEAAGGETHYALPETEYGFLPAALCAIGRAAYRRALLPFVEQFRNYADEMRLRADYPRNLDDFRALIARFEEWCKGIGDAYSGWVLSGQLMDYSGDETMGWDSFGDPDDPLSDMFFACRSVVFDMIGKDDPDDGDDDNSGPRGPARLGKTLRNSNLVLSD
ncbi:MAG TPA: hypothetical protein VIF88_03120 [Methylocystis sp.]|jgi:hypothetical protein